MEKPLSTLDIAVNIGKCLVTFYSVYFIISSICFGAFELEVFDGRMPFDFKRWINLRNCCVSYSRLEIANLVAMETTCFFSTWIFLIILSRRFWDYVLTITVIHVALSCIVMLSLPDSWSWWVCLALGVFIMTSTGELVLYFCRTYRISDKRNEHTLPQRGTGLTFYPKDGEYSAYGNVQT